MYFKYKLKLAYIYLISRNQKEPSLELPLHCGILNINPESIFKSALQILSPLKESYRDIM